MYALVVALALVSAACFTGAFALRRGRGWTLGFAAAHTALLYTHNWALFLGAGLRSAGLVLLGLAERPTGARSCARALLAAGVIFVLYLPWLPTMLYQAAHTGAPWADPPDVRTCSARPSRLLGYAASSCC